MQKILITLITSLAVGLLSVSGTLSAKGTPDGKTPAEESECDVLKGGTPGLYGLCVAYCEAQDLDKLDVETPDIAKHVSSNKLLENYRKKMRDGDSDMPCIKAPCPCWTAQELQAIDGSLGGAICVVEPGFSRILDASTAGPSVHHQAMATDVYGGSCLYTSRDARIWPTTNVTRVFQITPEDYELCTSQLIDQCNTIGLL